MCTFIYGRATMGRSTICIVTERSTFTFTGKLIKDKYHTVKTLSKSNRKIIERDGKIKNMVKL